MKASQVMIKNLPASGEDTTDTGSIHQVGRFPGLGNGNLLQYYCLKKSMDKGAWKVTIHAQRVGQNWTLSTGTDWTSFDTLIILFSL